MVSADMLDNRSAETRARLIEAGIILFARHTYEAVTTRMLSAGAGVNQAAIPYHFGGKEGVYLAVASAVCERVKPALEATLARAREIRPETPAAAAEALARLLPELADVAFAAPDRTASFTLFMREELTPTRAFSLYQSELLAPIHATVSHLLQQLCEHTSRELSHAYLGQLGGFITARHSLLWALRQDDYTPADVARIRAALVLAARLWVDGLRAQHAYNR